MRSLSLIVEAVTVLLAVSVSATPVAAPTSLSGPIGTPSPIAPSTGLVQVHGEIPAVLVGTWLTVLTTSPRQDRPTNAWHVYRFSQLSTGWRLQELDPRKVPRSLPKAVSAATKQAHPFEPTPAFLTEIAKPLLRLRARPEEDSFTQVVLREASQFEPQPTPLAHLQGAHFSIEILEKAGANGMVSLLGLYVKEVSKDTLSGSLQRALVASTGFAVVPIVIEGRFTMYRLR